jgi:hypothetical protein
MDELITELASYFHDEWRKHRLKSGTHGQPTAFYEPRLKDNGSGGEVDIANTKYQDLPEKWQAENRAAAIAVLEILKPEVAAEVHVEWSKRNPSSNLAEIPYELLPEEEKAKDRAQVYAAIDLMRKARKKGLDTR